MIKKILKESSIDYPGKFGPIVFTAGCNFRCSFCHNPELVEFDESGINEDKFISDIKDKVESGWYNGVCISGGEPTLHSLENFLRKLKNLGLSVKIDTNGTKPEVLRKWADEKLIDYIAMDVKASREKYNEVAGVNVDLNKIEESMKIVSEVGGEFRTTALKRYHNEGEIKKIAEWIKEYGVKFVIQGFRNFGVLGGLDDEDASKDFILRLKKTAEESGLNVEIRI